jgi:hypothetical protein
VVVERIVKKSSAIQYPMLTRTKYQEWSLGDCWGGGVVTENSDKIPEYERRIKANVRVKAGDDARGDKRSPKNCSYFKSCESFYMCHRAPFYRETEGLLHSDITLELKEYS